MQRLLICCAVGLALLFGAVAPTPASAYYYRHHHYAYRYHGGYYRYRNHGNYYQSSPLPSSPLSLLVTVLRISVGNCSLPRRARKPQHAAAAFSFSETVGAETHSTWAGWSGGGPAYWPTFKSKTEVQ